VTSPDFQNPLLQILVQKTPLAIAILDTEMRYLLVSPQWCQDYGLGAQTVIRQSHYDVFPEIPDRWRAIHQRCLAGASESCELDPFPRADGSVNWVKWAIYPWHTTTGEVGGLVMITEVVTQSEDKYRHLIENLHAGVVVHAPDTRILLCNSMACQLLGLTLEQMLGKAAIDPAWHFSFEDGTVMPPAAYPVNQVIATGQPLKNLIAGIHHSETSECTWVLVNAFPEVDSHQHLRQVIVTFTDMTEVKQAEAILAQQAAQEKLLSLMTERVRRSLDLCTILDTTVQEVCRFLQVDRATIYRLNHAQYGQMVAVAQTSDAPDGINGTCAPSRSASANPPAISHKLTLTDHQGHCLPIGEPYAIEDCRAYSGDLATPPVAAILSIPIFVAPTVWGVLVAQHSVPRRWQSTEIQLLQELVSQVGVAIQQSELYQKVQALSYQLEQEVQERTAQLQRSLDFEALLKRITDKVRDSLDERYILSTVVRELAEGLQVYSCDSDVFDLQNLTTRIQYEYIRHTIPTALGQQVWMADFPHIYEALLRGETLQFCWIPQMNPVRLTQNLLVSLACPISDDQQHLGSIWLYRSADYAFDPLEIQLVKQVANQCAIAIRQARLYGEVQAQVKELEHLHHLKDDFLSTVSHELRTPISNMKMATQMLEIGLEKVQSQPETWPRLKQYLQILKDEGKRQLLLINDLLDLSRLEAASEPLTLEAIDLNTWLPYLLEGFIDRANSHDQSLLMQLPDTLPPLYTNVNFLERVIMELLNNACKYTPAKGKIILTASVQADILQLCLQNTGIEIAPEELPRIFEKFYRIRQHDRWRQGGTGLGLALVKKLVERLGGNIDVESSANQVTFKVYLPLQQPVELP